MMGMALGLMLLAQGQPAAQTGLLAGQLRTVEGGPAVAIRVSVIPAPDPTVIPSFGGEYYYRQPPVTTTLTDDQGRYRLANIPPGRYLLVSGITYHPTTLDADRATIITVTPGSVSENFDFQLLRPLGGKVSGRLTSMPDDAGEMKAILSGPEYEEILEVPVGPDGAFEFGHVPRGAYLIDLAPPPPGMGSFPVQVGTSDVTGLQLVPPPTHLVTGRIVVQNGPLPRALLAFSTPQSYVSGAINPDGTFRARLHAARHHVELAGLPGGYGVAAVQVGSQSGSETLVVEDADVRDVVINVAAPKTLPHLRGKITGVANGRLSSAQIELSGSIIGSIETPVHEDGSFEFEAVTPGWYNLRLPQVPELAPTYVVVTWKDAEVQVTLGGR